MNKPKILFWDLETSHNIVASYSLFERRGLSLSHRSIRQERQVLCASWSLLGQREVESISSPFAKGDLTVIKRLHDVLSDVDAVVHHYGDAFDIPYFNTRALFHGFRPIPPIVQIDTKKIASSKFRFNSNRLDYLGRFLGLGNKIHTTEELWLSCLDGDPRALDKMVRYNIQDVRLLKRVFNKLKPYIPSKINYQLFGNPDCCPSCGSRNTQHRGYQYTKQAKWPRRQCTSCGHWFRTNRSVERV